MKKRQAGVTLLEVLATMTIFFLLSGVGMTMLTSLHLFQDVSEEKFKNHTDQNITVNTLTKELSDPVELYFSTSTNEVELRFKSFSSENAQSLVYSNVDGTMILYKSSSPNVTNFTRGSGITLSESVAGFILKQYNGPHITVSGPLATNTLYEVVLTFETYKRKVNGNSMLALEDITVVIKPFQYGN